MRERGDISMVEAKKIIRQNKNTLGGQDGEIQGQNSTTEQT